MAVDLRHASTKEEALGGRGGRVVFPGVFQSRDKDLFCLCGGLGWSWGSPDATCTGSPQGACEMHFLIQQLWEVTDTSQVTDTQAVGAPALVRAGQAPLWLLGDQAERPLQAPADPPA